MNYQLVKVHKDTINCGDMILFDGKIKTVCKKDIKYSEFMGITIFGNSFKLGYQLIKKVVLL